MASQRLATSQNIPNRINRKVQHGSNMFKHHQSSNIFTTCSPYHCRKLSKIYCKAQRHENPGEQEDHCTRLCQERYNESTRPPQRIALFRFLGTLKNLKKLTKRRVEKSEAITLSEISRNHQKSSEIPVSRREKQKEIELVEDTFRTIKLGSAADFDRCASVSVCKLTLAYSAMLQLHVDLLGRLRVLDQLLPH